MAVCHTVRTGVPQNSANFPLLFNFFITIFATLKQLKTRYADDMHVVEQSINPQTADAALTVYAEIMSV